MINELPPETVLRNYNSLLKVKPPILSPKYPYSSMDKETVSKTVKQIELVYQNLVQEVPVFVQHGKKREKNRWYKKGGGSHLITVFTL